jgi:long-subunit fatty acid transport protein
MIKKSIGFFAAACLLAGAGTLTASSVKPFDLSARAASMSGAFLAKADDASAMYYNPAGIAFHKGVRIKANLYFNRMTTTARIPGEGPVHTSDPFQFSGSFFLTWGIKSWLGIGIAGFNAYSAETEWISHWPGSLLGIFSRLNSFTFRPAIAVQPIKGFSLSIGLDFVSVHSLWSHGQPFPQLELLFDYTKIKGIGNGGWEFNSINSEENLNPEFDQIYGDFYGISPDYRTQKVDMTIKESTSLRFGAEVDISTVISVRAGYSTYKNGVTTETLNPVVPDLGHSRLSFGLGYEGALFSLWSSEKISELSIDVYIQYIASKEQTSAYPGFPYTYYADRWVFGFGVGLNL